MLRALICVAALLFTTLASAADGQSALILSHEGVEVHEDDFVHYIENRFRGNTDVARGMQRPGAYERVVEDLYVVGRIASLARAEGLRGDAELAWIAKDAVNRDLLESYLRTEVEKVLSDVDWDEAALEYYKANADKFMQGPSVNVDHVLISADDRDWPAFVARVDEVAAAISNNDDFNAVARTYSDEEVASKTGGKLGDISPGQTVPAFEKAAWSLTEPGQIAGPVFTQFGAHFIRYNGRAESAEQPFSQVRTQIINELRRTRGAQVRQGIVNDIRAGLEGATVNLDKPGLAQRLNIPYEPVNPRSAE